MTSAKPRQAEGRREANLEAECIILAEFEQYGDERSLSVRWARLVLDPVSTEEGSQ